MASLLSKDKSKSKVASCPRLLKQVLQVVFCASTIAEAEEDELVSALPAVPAVPALPMPQVQIVVCFRGNQWKAGKW